MKQAIRLLLLFSIFGAAEASDCDRSSGNSLIVVACLQEDYEKIDKELNRTYQKLLKSLAPQDKSDTPKYKEAKKHLTQAQNYWLKFIESDCSGQFKLAEGGTGRDAAELNCMNLHMQQRIKELRKWVE